MNDKSGDGDVDEVRWSWKYGESGGDRSRRGWRPLLHNVRKTFYVVIYIYVRPIFVVITVNFGTKCFITSVVWEVSLRLLRLWAVSGLGQRTLPI